MQDRVYQRIEFIRNIYRLKSKSVDHLKSPRWRRSVTCVNLYFYLYSIKSSITYSALAGVCWHFGQQLTGSFRSVAYVNNPQELAGTKKPPVLSDVS